MTWQSRRAAIAAMAHGTDDASVQEAGRKYLGALADYEQSVRSAPAGFVELQSTLLFALLGQRTGSHAAK